MLFFLATLVDLTKVVLFSYKSCLTSSCDVLWIECFYKYYIISNGTQKGSHQLLVRVRAPEHLHKDRCYSTFYIRFVFGLLGFTFCAHLQMKGKDISYLKALVISMLRTLLSILPLHGGLAHAAYDLGQRVQKDQSPHVQPLIMLSEKHLWNHNLRAKAFPALGEH